MSDDRSGEHGETLREALEREREQAGGWHRWHCTAELRSRVLAYALRCAGDGESHTRIAERLGLAQPTLSRWLRQGGAGDAGVRSVAIVPCERRAGAASTAPVSSPVRLVTPRGFVVEGLDAELLASLLQVLG